MRENGPAGRIWPRLRGFCFCFELKQKQRAKGAKAKEKGKIKTYKICFWGLRIICDFIKLV